MRFISVAVYVAVLSATLTAAAPLSNRPTNEIANTLVARMPSPKPVSSDSGTGSTGRTTPPQQGSPRNKLPAIEEDGVPEGVNEEQAPTGSKLEGKLPAVSAHSTGGKYTIEMDGDMYKLFAEFCNERGNPVPKAIHHQVSVRSAQSMGGKALLKIVL